MYALLTIKKDLRIKKNFKTLFTKKKVYQSTTAIQFVSIVVGCWLVRYRRLVSRWIRTYEGLEGSMVLHRTFQALREFVVQSSPESRQLKFLKHKILIEKTLNTCCSNSLLMSFQISLPHLCTYLSLAIAMPMLMYEYVGETMLISIILVRVWYSWFTERASSFTQSHRQASRNGFTVLRIAIYARYVENA